MTSERSDNQVVWLIEPDLMRSTRLAAALRQLGYQVEEPPADASSAAPPAAVLINVSLSHADACQRVRQMRSQSHLQAAPVLGYCGHVERDKRRAALEAGCDFVAAYSAVLDQLPAVLERVQSAASRRHGQ